MVRVNLADGSTRTFDLAEESKEVRELLASRAAEVRALTLVWPGSPGHTLARPTFGAVSSWEVEQIRDGGRIVRECATVYAHPVRLTLSVYPSGISRIDSERVGRLVLPAPRQ